MKQLLFNNFVISILNCDNIFFAAGIEIDHLERVTVGVDERANKMASKHKDGSSNSSPLFGRMSKRLAQLTKLGGASSHSAAASPASSSTADTGVTELRKQIDELERRLGEAEIQKVQLTFDLDTARAIAAANGELVEEHEQRIRHLTTKLDGNVVSDPHAGRLLFGMESEYQRQIDDLSDQCARALAELAKFRDGPLPDAGPAAPAGVDVFCDCRCEPDDVIDDVPFADDSDSDPFADDDNDDGLDVRVGLPDPCRAQQQVAVEVTATVVIGDPGPGDAGLTRDDPVTNEVVVMGVDAETQINFGDVVDEELIRKETERRLVENQLQEENSIQQQENRRLREEMTALQLVIDNTDQSLTGLTVQLALLRDECDHQNQLLTQANSNIDELKKQKDDLGEELVQNKEFQTSLESKSSDNESTIKKLTEEICDLKESIHKLETRIEALESEKKILEEQKENEIEELKKMFDEEHESWKAARAKLEKEYDFMRSCNAEREQQLMDDFEWKLREIEKESKMKTEKLRDLHKRIRDENDKLLIETNEHAEEVQRNAVETAERMVMTEAELRQLRGFTQELQKGVKVASDQLEATRTLENRLRDEVREARHQLAETRQTIGRLQTELSEARTAGERRLRAKELTLNFSFEEQLKKVNDQWEGKLKEETRKQKTAFEEEYFSMKMNALLELSTQKDQEMATIIKDYESKMAGLSEKLIRTSKKLEETERNLSDEIDLAKMAGNLKLNELQRQMSDRDREFQKKETELRAKEKQIEDLQMQLAAHRATLDLVRDETEKNKDQEIRQMKDIQDQQLEFFNKDWEDKLNNALEVQSHSHKTQIQSARVELEKAMEMTAQKETEQRECILDLKDAVVQRDEAIRALNEEVQRLQNGLCKMSKELEFHGKEILRVRNEASRQLRKSTTPDGAPSHGNKDTQPRTEDMVAIRQLREALLDKDRLVKKLQEEKKNLHAELRNQTIHNKRQLSTSQPVVNLAQESAPSVTKRNKQRPKDLSKRLSAPVLSQCDVMSGLNPTSYPEEDRRFQVQQGSGRSGRSNQHQKSKEK